MSGRSSRFEFLRSLELLRGFDDRAVQELDRELERVILVGGETLLRQGEPGHRVFLLRSGRLRVLTVDPSGEETPVGEIGRGEWVGEMALLTDQPRSATVRALRDCELLALSDEGFRRLLGRHPEAAMGLIRLIVRRLQRALHSGPSSGRPRTFALIPAGSGRGISRLLPPLVQALGSLGSTRVLTRDSLVQRFAPAGSDPSSATLSVSREEMIPWLNEQEEQAACLLYVATPDPTPWNEICIHQADRILLVGIGGEDPRPGATEVSLGPCLEERSARLELVLLHPGGAARPGGTAAWLESREVREHHHLRIGNAGDHQRLARLLTGRALGLVLGGGGARGLAHIGVLRALEELGIPVDLVGGTSFGAIVAALYAMGRSAEELQEGAKEHLSSAGFLRDFTLPLISLLRGRRIARLLDELLEGVRIEDLWLGFFCVSANLTRAGVVVHRQGSLRRAVRASISLPGVLPPVRYGPDSLLVDGGVLNNLPVDIMRQRCRNGRVLAVDVSAQEDLVARGAIPESLSGWRLLLDRLNPFHRELEIPSLVDILHRTTELGCIYAQRQSRGDSEQELILRPPVGEFGILDFPAHREIIEIGYREARERLREEARR